MLEVQIEKTCAIKSHSCPQCKCLLHMKDSCLLCCQKCDKQFQLRDGIPIFTAKEEYWCNVDKKVMHDLIAEVDSSNDWFTACNKYLGRYSLHFTPLYRGDMQFMFNIDSNSRVLDAGAMWGGLTIPVAQYCKEVHAVDKTWETLRLLQSRASQMGLNNVIPTVAPINQLPFADNYFDFIILNGVLEWLGFEQELILDQHWTGRNKGDIYKYKSSPEIMQRNALQELRRVLKKDGSMYIAIENRSGLQYFCGHPDDHMNVRFVTFMPRWWANFVTKLVRKAEYRTYVYTPKKLKKLVASAGFEETKLYTSYPHYQKISRSVPFTVFDSIKKLATQGYPNLLVYAMSKIWNWIPNPICKYLSPSLALIASGKNHANPRLINMLAAVDLIQAEASRYELILANNRYDDKHSANYLVYDAREHKIIFYCKISRDKNNTGLNDESSRWDMLQKSLKNSELVNTVPKLRFYGVVDNIFIQVSEYIEAQPVNKTMWEGLRRIKAYVGKMNAFKAAILNPIAATSRRIWLRKFSSVILRSISWLSAFQKQTTSGYLKSTTELNVWFDRQISLITENNLITPQVVKKISELKQETNSMPVINIPLVMQHGDFDICNVLADKKGSIYIIDFEHLEEAEFPFFDLGNLLFSPLILEWNLDNKNRSLAEYANKTGWSKYIYKWSRYYFEQMGLPKDWISFFPAICVIQQNAKQFPVNRNPYDYPMYGAKMLEQMLTWKL